MTTIVTRASKGSPLTNNEMDTNLTNLNTAKIEVAMINAATSKTTPVDADELALVDSADSYSLKKLTWANLKATLKTYFDTLYQAAGSYLTSASIGVTVQGYSAYTTLTNALQTFTASQRGTVTTDNDLSFDMNVTNNFKCTPTGTGALTFTNITAGQSGYILLVNSGGYAITAAATTKVGASMLSTISAAGTYLISYMTDGTNVYCTASGALS